MPSLLRISRIAVSFFHSVPEVRPAPILREFSPSVANALAKNGYAVVDDILSPSSCAALRREIDKLAASDHLRPNETHIVRADQKLTFSKRAVDEAELKLLPAAILANTPLLQSLTQDTSLLALLSVYWPRITLREHAIKVQRAERGCFPIHVDSAPEVDNRLVTALLYLHQWEEEHGGCLRLYDQPGNSVDVEPREGRLVLLSSANMHHRVLPSFHTRYVLTMWCSGGLRKDVFRTEGSLEERMAALLLTDRYRDMTFRLLLADEWESSLWEAHDPDVATEAVSLHRENLERITKMLPVALGRELQVDEEHVRNMLDDNLSLMFKRLQEQRPEIGSFRW